MSMYIIEGRPNGSEQEPAYSLRGDPAEVDIAQLTFTGLVLAAIEQGIVDEEAAAVLLGDFTHDINDKLEVASIQPESTAAFRLILTQEEELRASRLATVVKRGRDGQLGVRSVREEVRLFKHLGPSLIDDRGSGFTIITAEGYEAKVELDGLWPTIYGKDRLESRFASGTPERQAAEESGLGEFVHQYDVGHTPDGFAIVRSIQTGITLGRRNEEGNFEAVRTIYPSSAQA